MSSVSPLLRRIVSRSMQRKFDSPTDVLPLLAMLEVWMSEELGSLFLGRRRKLERLLSWKES